eukprot:GEMP01077253.1.p1 GENE.GEMP01077253.1~~GEMP01077253.1.p1  ORF type:complete len:266 (+),score=65.90 GEMP01077253.1:31-798(+)
MARALVCIKRVIDYAVKVRVKSDNTAVELTNIKMSMNPFCEIAVEEGIRLKEKGHISELIVMSCGAEKTQDTLRQALAMGADRAILVKTDLRTDQELQTLQVAKLIKAIVEKENPLFVLLGKQAIDDDSNQTGQLLGGLLNWPQGTFCSKIELNDSGTEVQVTREVDAGTQNLSMPLPAVLTADLRLNEPRYATLPNLMKAKKKPLEIIEGTSLMELVQRYETLNVENPPVRKGGSIVPDVDTLIDKLKNTAKVL